MKQRKLITVDQAIELANKILQVNPKEIGRNAYSKGTIYNQFHSGALKRYGPHHLAQLDEEEFLRWLDSRNKKGVA